MPAGRRLRSRRTGFLNWTPRWWFTAVQLGGFGRWCVVIAPDGVYFEFRTHAEIAEREKTVGRRIVEALRAARAPNSEPAAVS